MLADGVGGNFHYCGLFRGLEIAKPELVAQNARASSKFPYGSGARGHLCGAWKLPKRRPQRADQLGTKLRDRRLPLIRALGERSLDRFAERTRETWTGNDERGAVVGVFEARDLDAVPPATWPSVRMNARTRSLTQAVTVTEQDALPTRT